MHPDSYAMAIIAGLSLFPEISNLGADGLLQFEEAWVEHFLLRDQINS